MAEKLHMNVTKDHKRKLRRIAESRRLTVSDVVRDLIDDAPMPMPKVQAKGARK